jgi:hypothetical protein
MSESMALVTDGPGKRYGSRWALRGWMWRFRPGQPSDRGVYYAG